MSTVCTTEGISSHTDTGTASDIFLSCTIIHYSALWTWITKQEKTKQTCSSLLRRPRVSPMERMTPGRVRAVWLRRLGPLGTESPYGWGREYGFDIEVMTVGWTIHCKSWLVVMALMVGIKALLEPGISTLYFWKEKKKKSSSSHMHFRQFVSEFCDDSIWFITLYLFRALQS